MEHCLDIIFIAVRRHSDYRVITVGSYAALMRSSSIVHRTGGSVHFVTNGLYARWMVSKGVNTHLMKMASRMKNFKIDIGIKTNFSIAHTDHLLFWGTHKELSLSKYEESISRPWISMKPNRSLVVLSWVKLLNLVLFFNSIEFSFGGIRLFSFVLLESSREAMDWWPKCC